MTGKYNVQRIYDSVRVQAQLDDIVAPSNPGVKLARFEWDIVLALLAQELGIQSLKECGLREAKE